MADGKVIIDTELNTSGAVKGINTLKSGIGSAVGTIAKIGTAGVTAGSALTAALTKSAVDSYGAYEQLVGGIETLFGEAQQTVFDNAKQAYKTAGLSQNEYMENVISYAASLKKSTADEKEAANIADQIIIDMADNVNKMGTSMDMVQNAYKGFTRGNYTMLDNLALGYAGTKEGMKELLKDARKLTGVKYKIGNMADMANAIHAVQVEMGITGTTSKESMETLQGSARSAKAAWDNLLVGLADENADIDKLIEEFVTSTEGAFNNIFPRITKVLGGIGNLISKSLPKVLKKIPEIVRGALPDLISAGSKLFMGLVQGLTVAIPEIVKISKDLLSELISTITEGDKIGDIMSFASMIFDSLISAVDTYAPKLGEFAINMFNTILNAFNTYAPTAISMWSETWTNIYDKMAEYLPDAIGLASSMLQGILDAILTALPVFIEQLPPMFETMINMLYDMIVPMINLVQDTLQTVMGHIPDVVNSIVSVVPEMFGSLLDAIISHAPDVAMAFLELFGSIWMNLPDILGSLARGVVELVKGLIQTLLSKIPDVAEAGVKFFLSLKDKAPDIINGLRKFALDLLSNILSVLGSLVGGLADIATQMVDGFGDALSTAWETVSETVSNWVSDVIDAIVGFFDDCWESITGIGKHLVEGIWEGISGAGGWLLDNISGFASGVVDGIAGVFGISSPSKVMRDEIGKYLAQGIWVGFDENNPMEQINKELKYGMRGLNNTMTLSGGYYAGINYNKIGEAVTEGFLDANVKVAVDNREFGRLERGYA